MVNPYTIRWSSRFRKDYIHENVLVLELTRTGSHSDLFG